jgi:hypothetical protein
LGNLCGEHLFKIVRERLARAGADQQVAVVAARASRRPPEDLRRLSEEVRPAAQ